MLSGTALDFHHASPLTHDSMGTRGVDDHHIFPQAYLNPTGEQRRQPQELVDCVLNRTLIDADTNRRIGKRPPSDYLEEIRGVLLSTGPAAFDAVLNSHLLPNGSDSPLSEDRFEDFLTWRQAAMSAQIEHVTHAPA